MGIVNDIDIRPARDGELPSVAELRWRWLAENQETPVVGYAEFVRQFVAWAAEHAPSHRCLVALRDDVVIGMAWLAIVPRVPTPRGLSRESGDVQCVYVIPGERDRGCGGRLLEAILDLARELRLHRVTVHSSPRAIPAYSRHGFANSPRLLQAYPAD